MPFNGLRPGLGITQVAHDHRVRVHRKQSIRVRRGVRCQVQTGGGDGVIIGHGGILDGSRTKGHGGERRKSMAGIHQLRAATCSYWNVSGHQYAARDRIRKLLDICPEQDLDPDAFL